jgi:hypothetical protein
MSRNWFFFGIAAVLSAAAACSPVPAGSGSAGNAGNGGNAGAGNGGSAGSANGGNAGSANGGNAGDGVGGFAGGGPGGGTGTGMMCNSGPDEDKDKDGYTVNQGDCNDCDPNVNPGAIEVATEMGKDAADEDCDGKVDNVAGPCDDALAIGDPDAYHGAAAVELCQKASAADKLKKWGVLSAKWTRANGSGSPSPLQYGLMAKFGPNVNVQGGKRMLALSSGNARTPSDPDPCGTQSCHPSGQGTPPAGFPQQVCNAANSIFDDVALDLDIRVPTNATGYSFNFKFYSFEWAEWVCTSYNDQFIALASPAPMGSINGNISFDSKNHPVSVNLGFFDACDPSTCQDFASFCVSGCPAPPNPCCPSGPGQLQATGFDVWGDAGGTSWLKTQAPVKGGSDLKLRFTIWDTGDENLDSTALVDNFQWVANGGTVVIGTTPIPDPK